MKFKKPNLLCYRIGQVASWVVATFIFKRKILRNEIKGKKGPFVVIANHQAALDFVNLIGMNRNPMTFVISNSFYNSLPITGFLSKMGVIPKQQFQTTRQDLKMMKEVVDNNSPLVIYPAGLMCEDGISTPIPEGTYKFLKWMGADVYMAKISGTYFAMPKWSKKMRPGKTFIDVYKLFSKDELSSMNVSEIREKAEDALNFDAYREQEKHLVKHKNGNNIEGLENVLYVCPHCKSEFTVKVKNKNTIYCENCGYEQISDEYAFFKNTGGVGNEMRYVSDWSKLIYEKTKENVISGKDNSISSNTKIHMIDYKKHKFIEVGEGTVTLTKEGFTIGGKINGEEKDLFIPISNIPTLPFSPGRYIEVQHGETIYRCCLENGRLAMKFINLVKVFHELNSLARKSR